MIVYPKTKIEFVDLGLPSGVKWATCNVGASFPEDCGANVSHLECENWRVKMEVEGRVPSRRDWTELIQECVWRMTIQNGVKGELVVGPNGNSIFLPVSFSEGCEGKYWSSTPDDNDVIYRAYYMDFDFIGVRMNTGYRNQGLCLRFVSLWKRKF